jgi:hypothetical protein
MKKNLVSVTKVLDVLSPNKCRDNNPQIRVTICVSIVLLSSFSRASALLSGYNFITRQNCNLQLARWDKQDYFYILSEVYFSHDPSAYFYHVILHCPH